MTSILVSFLNPSWLVTNLASDMLLSRAKDQHSKHLKIAANPDVQEASHQSLIGCCLHPSRGSKIGQAPFICST